MNRISFKKILIPVDFSKTSHKVFHHVKFLAQKFSSDVTIMHVAEEWQYSGTFPFLSVPEVEFKSKYGAYALEKLEKLKEELVEAGVKNIAVEYAEGNIVECIENIVEKQHIDLVAMGTHGAKGISRFLIGSNAYKVINYTDIPVLTVHDKSAFGPYKNIVAPLDDSQYSRAKFPYIAQLAIALDADVEILYPKVKDSDRKDTIAKYFEQVSGFLEKNNVKHISKEVDGDFAHEVIKFAEYTNADLIVIMSDSETTISNMLVGSDANQIVNHSTVPVITLHPDDKGKLMDIFS